MDLFESLCCTPLDNVTVGFLVVEDPVAFSVSLQDNYSPSDQEKIPYSNIITNVGNGYITERREFVCPHAGLYVFYAGGYGRNDAACRLDITKNDIFVGRAYFRQDYRAMGSNLFVLELGGGEAVSVVSGEGGCQLTGNDNSLTSFSGFRIN